MNEKRGEHPFGDTGQLLFLALFLVVWLLDSFIWHWSTFLSLVVPDLVRHVLLGLCVLPAIYLLWTGHVVLSGPERPNFVVDQGAFHFVRHPLYLAACLGFLGTALSSLSLISLALVVPIFVFYNYLASYEEKLLEIKLGQPYREYEKLTGKWLPRWPRSG